MIRGKEWGPHIGVRTGLRPALAWLTGDKAQSLPGAGLMMMGLRGRDRPVTTLNLKDL